MDKKDERNTARRILRAVAANVAAHGYTLTKPTYLTKPTEHLILFFHFHKFTFGPFFRLHGSVRILNDDCDHIPIGGLSIEHAGRYGDDPKLVESCIRDLTHLVLTTGIAWHDQWRDPRRLLDARDNIMRDSSREWLRRALAGDIFTEHYDLSQRLLGLNRNA